jgi:methylated-DNA-[protein]-cysteine S-methyltransferase
VTFRVRARKKSDVCRECRTIERAFERYFAGEADALVQVEVDLSGARSDFNRHVLQTLHDSVPPGETTSYAALAAATGRPGAARAVGSAMANNPVPMVVPCHRVLASDGGLGGYGGGLTMKRRLLEIEGVDPSSRSNGKRKGSRSR